MFQNAFKAKFSIDEDEMSFLHNVGIRQRVQSAVLFNT
jgi:hypothetical protein